MHKSESRLLRGALRANALFSASSGLVALAAAPAVGRMLGDAPVWLMRLLGFGLVLFALLVAWQARAPRRVVVLGIVAADVAWVVGSVLLATLGGAWLSARGTGLVLAPAGVVAVLAALQSVGLRRAAPVSPGPPATSVELRIAAPPPAVWRVVGEQWGEVHKLVPRIAHSRMLNRSAPCAGATRECTLAAPVMGVSELRERLVEWDPPVGFAYEVVDPPFPMARLRNTWRIGPDGAGTRLTLAPELELRGGRSTRWLRGVVLRSMMRELERDLEAMGAAIEREAIAGETARAKGA